jgi:mono/diheme cytochrome c family protein
MTARLVVLVLPVVTLVGCGQGFGDPRDAAQVTRGQALYSAHCASCHGAKLEGQPDWKKRLPNGRLPAPPHDADGHTWHHPDSVLFDITKRGASAVVGRGHESDMPPFAGVMSDEDIWSILAFIKSSWPPDIQQKQAQINARSVSRR